MPCGNTMADGTSSEILDRSATQRLLVFGSVGRLPIDALAAGVSYQRKPPGWPWNEPCESGLSELEPFHGPWLSAKNASPKWFSPMPPGERMPLAVGISSPSFVTRTHQPR